MLSVYPFPSTFLFVGFLFFANFLQAIYNCAIFYNATLGFVKLSVLCLYRRILRGVSSKKLKIANWIVFGIVGLNTSINVGLACFQCRPIDAAFDLTIEGECINTNAFYLGNAITGIITDTLVYTLSIPIIKPLNMEQKKKILTLLTLLVGALYVYYNPLSSIGNMD